MKEFLEKTLRQNVIMTENKEVYKKLPLAYRGRYDIFTVETNGILWMAIHPKDNVGLVILRRDRAGVEKMTGLNCAIFLDRTTFYIKEKMMEEGIPFVIEEKQVFLPFIGYLLSKENERELAPVYLISFLTQKMLLMAIYERWNQNITQVTTCQKFDKKIFVNGIEYYNHYLVLHSAFDTKLIIGNCLTMTTPVVADANESSIKTTIHIDVKGTLREQIKGFEFIQAVYANNGYEIENTHISILLKEKHFEEKIQGYSNRLSWLKYILDLLKSMHVKKDLEIENFSEEDEKNLNFLIAAHGKHKPVREEERQLECLQLLKISNISLGVIYIKHTDGYYYMHDYFGEHLESYWKDGDKATRISQFTVMTMADFLKYDNIRLPMIADDFKLLPCSEEIINEANLLMLEMIKAYDKSKNDELLVTAKKINDWLQEHPKLIGREVCIINKYQIKIRKTYLGYSDKAELFSIIEKSENNNYRAGAFILLGEFDEAKKIFDSYGEEQMQEFINYPIYTLYQQSGENLM